MPRDEALGAPAVPDRSHGWSFPLCSSDSWRSVLSDPGLPHALFVTFLVMVLSWAVQTPASILIGVFLAGHQRYRGLLAVMFFIPVLLSSAAIAITFKALLDPNFGLGAGLHVDFLSQDWLGVDWPSHLRRARHTQPDVRPIRGQDEQAGGPDRRDV